MGSASELSPMIISLLEHNPNVVKVISDRIVFTTEFKELAYRELCQGKRMKKILLEHDIDPEWLGKERITSFTYKLREKATRPERFMDCRKDNSKTKRPKDETEQMAAELEMLCHKLAYAQQEVEFLKKIHTADLEAQKLWESKHRPK